MNRNLAPKPTLLAVVALLALTALILFWMGRAPWGTAPGPGLWTGDIHSEFCSQRLADPYSFSHVVHGLVFFLLLSALSGWWFGDRIRLVAATALEGAWEVLENTPMVIETFRENTIAQGYYGDSILNSVGDMLAMVVGFTVAMHLRNRWVFALFVAIELALLFWIRDNMTLNLLMLVYPVPGIREWQAEL